MLVYKNKRFSLGLLLGFLLLGCSPDAPLPGDQLFTLMPSDYTQVDFINQLEYDRDFNIYTYRNFYNGGGVSIGDINNDGLPDLYLTANMKSNRLYLNKGDFQFEDVTEQTGVGGTKSWSTGVSMADVNGDGWLDIYVCNSGNVEGDNKQNELYINQGDLTFKEKAAEYGIADQGYSTHGVFFDYDKDGDLDLYLLNNSYQAIGSFNLRKNVRSQRDPVGGDKLYRNDNDRFVDVSEEAGIFGSIIGFGLGVTVGDLDRDSWPDVYVSNDFFERDYIYMNNGDGTFREELPKQMPSISAASMGADLADINNDGLLDLFVTEMLPEHDYRLKTSTTFDNWDRYQYSVQNDYHHQFTRNMLQLNNGNNTFSDIGRLAGVHATDWSWGALIIDMDNDGWRDIFVANGIYQDLTNQDFIQYISNEETVKSIVKGGKVDYKALIDAIPSNRLPNYAFHNNQNLTFDNKAPDWGLATPSHSNGSAYGDLDNDGDLDLVVNNVNMELFVYRNESNHLHPERHYLQVQLQGKGKNPYAIGTQIELHYQDQTIYQEQMPMRGFQSSMDYVMNIGLGDWPQVDRLVVTWPDGTQSIQTNVAVNQLLQLQQSEGKAAEQPADETTSSVIFKENTNAYKIDFQHQENRFVDFDRDRLIYHMLSSQGPHMDVADVNGDGLEDFYIGGASGQAGRLMVQNRDGSFRSTNTALLEKDRESEDLDILFFDADQDGDMDLYVAGGGNEFSSGSSGMKDRLYFNDGIGNFSVSDQILPAGRFESSGCVAAADYDSDGDQDLFVGIRVAPKYYGVPVNGILLENDGTGKFSNQTEEKAKDLLQSGLFTDAWWMDYDGDQDSDLIAIGDWMGIRIFQNSEGQLSEVTKQAGLEQSKGWWNCMKAGDLDGDGDMDLVLGNHGLNSQFKASSKEPITLYINDFDNNGTVEQILCRYDEGVSMPYVLRHDLVMQMPHLKKKYLKYESFAGQTIEQIFSPEAMKGTVTQETEHLANSLAINNGDGTFELKALPLEAQFAPMYGLLIDDFDGDQHLDILMAGNFYEAKPEVGRYDADYGILLKGDGKGNFEPCRSTCSGFLIDGQVRDMEKLTVGGKSIVLVGRNNDRPQVFEY
jgi:hypothetical protein